MNFMNFFNKRWVGLVLCMAFCIAVLAADQKPNPPTQAKKEQKEPKEQKEQKAQKGQKAQSSKLLAVPSVKGLKSSSMPEARLPERDPFRQLLMLPDSSKEPVLPGKRGLKIKELQVKGIVKSENRWIALVQGPQSPAALFLHDNDELADGVVKAIQSDSVVFEEHGKDPLGKPFTREVVKRISGFGGAIQ